MMDGVYTKEDTERLKRTFRRLLRHDISRWALTGGQAVEMHLAQHGGQVIRRRLSDMDFLVTHFEDIPESLGEDFLFRHVHPLDPPGKTLLQCVDEETGLRVDVFRAYGGVMERAGRAELFGEPIRMISFADLTARAARLSWNLAEGGPVSPKYVRDFLRLLEVSAREDIESAWQDHRQHRPAHFAHVAEELKSLKDARPELLVETVYSTDITECCDRCRGTDALPLANAGRVMEILGYC